MRKNQVLAKLRAGQVTGGFWMNVPSPVLAELAAHAGFDWIVLDAQHGYWGYEALFSSMQVISATETVPLVRVLRNDPAAIGQVLDAGALGIIVPLVNSAEEAVAAVAAARYPPQGQRSIGGGRLRLYGDDYWAAANGEILVSAMIETRQAGEKAQEILSVPGVDLGFIGPVDLAQSMGVEVGSEAHETMIQRVLAAGKACGTPVGIYCTNVEDAIRRAEEGFQFIPYIGDLAIFSGGIRDALRRWNAR